MHVDLEVAIECPRTLAPFIDPLIHTCGRVVPHGEIELRHPEIGYYSAGMKSFGRAPSFLLRAGYRQVASIAAHLAGDSFRCEDYELPAEVSMEAFLASGIHGWSVERDGLEIAQA